MTTAKMISVPEYSAKYGIAERRIRTLFRIFRDAIYFNNLENEPEFEGLFFSLEERSQTFYLADDNGEFFKNTKTNLRIIQRLEDALIAKFGEANTEVKPFRKKAKIKDFSFIERVKITRANSSTHEARVKKQELAEAVTKWRETQKNP